MHILLTGHVAAIKPDIGCFIFDLRQSFLDEPIASFLTVHVFFAQGPVEADHPAPAQHMPEVGNILSLKGRLLNSEDNRLTIVLDVFAMM